MVKHNPFLFPKNLEAFNSLCGSVRIEKILRSNDQSGPGVDTSEMGSTQGHSGDTHKAPTPQEWEDVKATLYDLYVKRDLPLKDVQVEMECRGHIAR